ncbi:Nif11-like leader peptide family natural product precursor [Actinomadura sp. ATCC 31491]|uniref:Nif11-like leader peptide family natural product n=1 Tax=Actinomadura luzonensis TaxID=2805427 RepID=A0ABT0G7T6_9ACTN|nr:Nif11-like leader peptide family natural product precursor [Actinomadura luzonensis]MCK2220642.1 Nif11-like leader peptide family natural product precursor [Actinomadura luzonensis]
MSETNLIGFLRGLAERPELCDRLKDKPKDEVIAAAAVAGMPFTAAEFDALIWSLEERLAGERGEEFNERFPLWDLLWGRYYLEFLVHDLVPSLDETGLLAGLEPAP